MNLKTGALIAVVALVGVRGACVLITDGATRLAEGAYVVELQESLHQPESGGSLLVGCKGTPNFLKLGYSYSTTSHLNAVRVLKELRVDKEAGETVRVTLRK